MSTSALHIPQCGPAEVHAETLYFESGEKRLFGWLHLPADAAPPKVGLVICKPFGYESICAHRSVRAFAQSAAAVGVPTLRFDYLGTGDSPDIDANADQLTVWKQDVIAAVAELQRRTGVDQVCLIGIRLGALLAALAASQCKPVKALILISPIIKGRRYVREMRTTRLAASMGSGRVASTAADQAENAGAMEISGFSLSAATIEHLSQIDLSARGAPVPEMLVIDGNSLPVARAWAESLSQLGAKLEYLVLPGLIEMLMTAPQYASIPIAMVDAVRDWLLRLKRSCHAQTESGYSQGLGNKLLASSSALVLPFDGPSPRASITERPVFFGSNAVLFGIVTEPPTHEQRRRAVILLNAGADHHIGATRIYVSLARQWAQRGYTVLRMDLAGLGDSGTQASRPDNAVFPPAAMADIRDAVEFMRTDYAPDDLTIGGLCSGAYHALRAAVEGLPINRILLINPQNFFWKEGMKLDDLQMAEVVRNPAVYRERVLSAVAWKRLLSGQVNIWRLVRVYPQRLLLALESSLRDLARVLGLSLPHDLGRELEKIGARDVQVIFAFARGEPGINLLKLQGGSAVKRLGERCRVHIIDGADHVFSQRAPRIILERILSDELFAKSFRNKGSNSSREQATGY